LHRTTPLFPYSWRIRTPPPRLLIVQHHKHLWKTLGGNKGQHPVEEPSAGNRGETTTGVGRWMTIPTTPKQSVTGPSADWTRCWTSKDGRSRNRFTQPKSQKTQQPKSRLERFRRVIGFGTSTSWSRKKKSRNHMLLIRCRL
jgi:hypothetical protein